MFTPVIDTVNVPIARELDDNKAINESPCNLLFSFNLNIKNDDSITIGSAKYIGVKLSTEAIANAPNPTCDSPSPIIEFLLKTKDTPISDAHKEISIPTINAFIIKEYENISIILLMMHSPYKFFSSSKEYFIFP